MSAIYLEALVWSTYYQAILAIILIEGDQQKIIKIV